MGLNIEIVTPRGVAFARKGLDKVILRRQEERFEQGSEVVVLPHHGEMMVRVPDCTIGLVDEKRTVHLHIAGGFAEVRDDTVTILTASADQPETYSPTCAE
jgi:F0F1-type ATP synthase epsilon subunit